MIEQGDIVRMLEIQFANGARVAVRTAICVGWNILVHAANLDTVATARHHVYHESFERALRRQLMHDTNRLYARCQRVRGPRVGTSNNQGARIVMKSRISNEAMDRFRYGRTIFVLFALCAAVAGASPWAVYHVSPTGDDAAAGTEDAPFRTIQHAASLLQGGDQCIVHEGVYRESVRPAASGAGRDRIVFRAAEDEKVVIRGTELVTGWERHVGNIWKAPVDGPVTQAFIDGVMTPEASWPNTGNDPFARVWAEADEGTDTAGIVDAALPELDVTGARVHVLPGRRWVSWVRPVEGLDASQHRLNVNVDWDQNPAYVIGKGTRYYLFGAYGLLDAPGEWVVDDGTMYLVAPEGSTPEAWAVEVKRRDWAFDLSESMGINLKDFYIFGASIRFGNATSCWVSNCHIRYASHFTNPEGWAKYNDTGLVVSGGSNLVMRSSVYYSAGNGVTLLGQGNVVRDCVVRYASYMATDCAAVWMEGEGNALEECTLSDTGRSVLIHRYLENGRIEYNDMYNAGLLTTDLGITYCFQTDGEGTKISHNWVHDNRADHVGVGIYIDNGSSNFVIDHNVSWNNPDSGIRLNTPSHDNLVCNNTVLNNGNSLGYWGPDNLSDQEGVKIYNNIFTDKVSTGDGVDMDANYAGSEPMLRDVDKRDFRPVEGSPCINAGRVVEEITGDDTPDIGAYEHGDKYWVSDWKAGHRWGEPPEF